MGNSRTKKTVIFLLILLIICIVVFSVYYFLVEHKNPFLEFFKNVTSEEKINDNYNGIYTYEESLNGSYYIFNNCSVTNIKNYILIKDDKYYTYRSTCMGTYYKEEGNTKDLTFVIADSNDTYMIKYNGNDYLKDVTTTYIKPNNEIGEKLKDLSTDSLQLIFDETQFVGNEYDISGKNIKNNKLLRFSYYKEPGVIVIDNKSDKDKTTLYDYFVKDKSKLPKMYLYGENIAIVEQDDNKSDSNKYAYMFYFLTPDGINYDLRKEFPIMVDDDIISYDRSVYVSYNPRKRNFTILIGDDKKMCDDNFDNSNGDKIAYYEFELNYNYIENSFSRPTFVKKGYMSEGCRYVNSIKER